MGEYLGYIAVFFSIFAFSSESKKNMRIYGSVSLSFFMISVYLLSGLNGAFVSLLSLIVRVLSIFINEKKLHIFKYISPVFALVFFLYFNTEGLIGILPSIALVVVIFADLEKDLIRMKMIYILNLAIWLVYVASLHSISGILYETIGIFVLIYSILKLKGTKLWKLYS